MAFFVGCLVWLVLIFYNFLGGNCKIPVAGCATDYKCAQVKTLYLFRDSVIIN